MGHQYLLESNYSCLWKHVENNLFLSNFMKISSPSLNIFHTLVKLCARKNTIQLKVKNIENANNTHIKQKQQKNDRTSKCQQILPQWSSVDSVRKDS